MPGDEGVLADAPVIRNQMKIAMTNAAMGDADLNFLHGQLSRVIAKSQEFGARCVSC